MKETDLFEPVKQHYISLGCEVFSEVLSHNGKRADVVVRDNNIITVIELKTSLSLDLLEQCYEWIGHAHYIYACVPALKNSNSLNRYSKKCLISDGIGLLNVKFTDSTEKKILDKYNPEKYNIAFVNTIIPPHLNRKISTNWNECLTEKHKFTLPGGTKGGGYITPYSEMMEYIKRRIERRKEVEFDDLLDLSVVKEHYSSPKQSLIQALRSFESDWCEVYKKDGVTYCKAI